jgi:hypothetical protein
MSDIKEADARMIKILGDIKRLISIHPDFARVLKEARYLQPRIENLEKIGTILLQNKP